MPREIALKYKKSIRGKVFNIETFLVLRAKDAEKILTNSTQHLTKGFVYNFLHPFLKTGLLTSDGEKWHTRRRMLTPAFHFNILKEYCEVFKEESVQLVEILKNTNGKVIDVVPVSTQFTLNTVCGENGKTLTHAVKLKRFFL
jgi:cytochrome P450 family 4